MKIILIFEEDLSAEGTLKKTFVLKLMFETDDTYSKGTWANHVIQWGSLGHSSRQLGR